MSLGASFRDWTGCKPQVCVLFVYKGVLFMARRWRYME